MAFSGSGRTRNRGNRERKYHDDRHYFRDHKRAYSEDHTNELNEDAKTKFCEYAYDKTENVETFKTPPTQQGNTCYAHAFTAQAHAIHEKRGGNKTREELFNEGNWASNDNLNFNFVQMLQDQCLENDYDVKPHTNIQGVQNELNHNRPVTMGIVMDKNQWIAAEQYLKDEPKAHYHPKPKDETKADNDSEDETEAHAMTVMGVYDGTKGQYLNIQNQYGPKFGDKGYLRMTPDALPMRFVNLAGKEDNAPKEWEDYESADLELFTLNKK